MCDQMIKEESKVVNCDLFFKKKWVAVGGRGPNKDMQRGDVFEGKGGSGERESGIGNWEFFFVMKQNINDVIKMRWPHPGSTIDGYHIVKGGREFKSCWTFYVKTVFFFFFFVK